MTAPLDDIAGHLEWPSPYPATDDRLSRNLVAQKAFEESSKVLESRVIDHVLRMFQGAALVNLQGLAVPAAYAVTLGEPFHARESTEAFVRLRGMHEPHLELQALQADIAAIAHSHRRLAADVQQLKKQRVFDEEAKARVTSGMKLVGSLRPLFTIQGEDLELFEHFAARRSLAGKLIEAAEQLRQRFGGAPLVLSWEDRQVVLVAQVKLVADEAEDRFLEFLGWWSPKVTVEDNVTVTLDYL